MITQISKALLLASALCLGSLQSAHAATALFAGGCFWCVESDFEKLNGVHEAVSGFSGGSHPNPTYSGAHDGHYEVVQVQYDPAIISYQQLLDHFWLNHDPFDPKGQFCDKGPSYRAAIFVANDTERQLAEASKQRVIAQFPGKFIATPILQASTFYPVKGEEAYHQNYARNNPLRYRYYRNGCGRDKRLKQIWGSAYTH